MISTQQKQASATQGSDHFSNEHRQGELVLIQNGIAAIHTVLALFGK
jgi:hypothetical protein